jgi:hypothetical protein
MFLFPTTVPKGRDERKMLGATQLPIPRAVAPQLHPATAGLGATVHVNVPAVLPGGASVPWSLRRDGKEVAIKRQNTLIYNKPVTAIQPTALRWNIRLNP